MKAYAAVGSCSEAVARGKVITRILIAFQAIFWLAIAPATHAQWATNPIPSAGGISAVQRFDLDTGPAIVARVGPNASWIQTLDGGRTWAPWLAGQGIARDASIVPIPAPNGLPSRKGDVYLVTYTQLDIFSGFRCTIQRSADFGRTATTMTTFGRWCWITIDPSSTQVLYGLSFDLNGLTFPNIARSLDGGTTWAFTGQNLPGPARYATVGPDGTVYAMLDVPYVSHDHGTTWKKWEGWPSRSITPYASFRVLHLAAWTHPIHGAQFALAATTDGLYQSTDSGNTWSPAGLQGFLTTGITALETPSESGGQAIVSYRGGLALWRDGIVEPYSGGLPGGETSTHRAIDERYALSSAGLSYCASPSTCKAGSLPGTLTLVEFHNSALDHYFMTARDVEAALIDQGNAGPGWSRTGQTFRVYRDLTGNLQTGVCRFYGTPGVGPNSHFFTVDPEECSKTQADPGWTLETWSGFIATAPTLNNERPQSWDCGSGRFLYRLYNKRVAERDSNHRYVADPDLYRSMEAKGWEAEGTRLCVLP